MIQFVINLVHCTSSIPGFKLRISGVGSDCSTKWATTTALVNNLLCSRKRAKPQRVSDFWQPQLLSSLRSLYQLLLIVLRGSKCFQGSSETYFCLACFAFSSWSIVYPIKASRILVQPFLGLKPLVLIFSHKWDDYCTGDCFNEHKPSFCFYSWLYN